MLWTPKETHPGLALEVETDPDGAVQRCHSVTHTVEGWTLAGADAQAHFEKVSRENRLKSSAQATLLEHAPSHMKGNLIDPWGRPKGPVTFFAEHEPSSVHHGEGAYTWTLPGADEATIKALGEKLSEAHGNAILIVTG